MAVFDATKKTTIGMVAFPSGLRMYGQQGN
jgi:hypothetical protein